MKASLPLMMAVLCLATSACGQEDGSKTSGGTGGTGGPGHGGTGATGSGGVGGGGQTGDGGSGGDGDGTDAGTGGGAESGDGDGDGDGVDRGCADHDYLLCEDFELAIEGALPVGWSPYGGWVAGEALVTADAAHSGQRSLAAASASSGQPRVAHGLSELGAAADHHWGRIFYKVATPPTLPTPGAVIHNTLVGLIGGSESRVVDTVVNSDGDHQFLYNLPDDSCCGGSSYDYRSYDGQWHCAEWFVDATTESFRFYFDGTEVGSIGFQGDPPGGGDPRMGDYQQIALGWINYQQADPPYQAWFDDLAIDDQRVGCQ